MERELTPAERLIVAADFKPRFEAQDVRAIQDVRGQVLALADSLEGTGVVIKVNSILRAYGYDLVDEIHSRGLRVFADLKLVDISETLVNDGLLLRETRPDLLTVMCVAGAPAMQLLKATLPDTEVLGVTVLTSLKEADTQRLYSCSVNEAVMRFAQEAADGGVDGLISSPAEVNALWQKFGDTFSYNTPGIRPLWHVVENDDQNKARVMTPSDALKTSPAKRKRIVVGRPITQADNPYEATLRTIDEIISAMV